MTVRTAPTSVVPSPGHILVADDEPAMRMAIREVLTRSGWQVTVVESGEAALAALASERPAEDAFRLLLTDFRMGGITGLELLRFVHERWATLPVVIMTAYGTVEDAVSAMREGAADYLLKPFSMETLLGVVQSLAVQQAESAPAGAQAEDAAPRVPLVDCGEPELIASAPPMRALLQVAAQVADAPSTVLLTGESGTGKEMLARFIHARSKRAGALIGINCAALPEGLLESELFGHERGAFTGAVQTRKGRFEQAQGGTLLLDEISEMPLGLQAKLLRVLQEREVTPVGGAQNVRLDVRVIATTNRDLDQLVARGEFRQDLFYRLNVIALDLPPLRERREDVVPLAEFFLKRFRRPGRPGRRLAPELIDWLRAYAWPGNVRELENMLERACLLARDEMIRVDDLHLPRAVLDLGAAHPAAAFVGATPSVALSFSEPMKLEEMERRMIILALEKTGGNRTRTAEVLGVSVRTIRNKLHQYGLHELADSCAP